MLARRLKLDDGVWGSRCHGKLRASLISAALSVKTRRHARSSPPQHFGGRKERSPLLAGDDCRITAGSVSAAVLSMWSVWSRQATGTVWPKSQMALGAVGAQQSRRLKKLSAPLPSSLWLKVEADSSRGTYYTSRARYFKAAFKVSLFSSQFLCRHLGQVHLSGLTWHCISSAGW